MKSKSRAFKPDPEIFCIGNPVRESWKHRHEDRDPIWFQKQYIGGLIFLALIMFCGALFYGILLTVATSWLFKIFCCLVTFALGGVWFRWLIVYLEERTSWREFRDAVEVVTKRLTGITLFLFDGKHQDYVRESLAAYLKVPANSDSEVVAHRRGELQELLEAMEKLRILPPTNERASYLDLFDSQFVAARQPVAQPAS